MRLNNFCLLSSNDQIKILYAEGIYIGKRKENGNKVLLYQLAGFYVEIHYSLYRQKIDHLNYFADTDCLSPYLKHIDVEELMKYVS